MSITWKILGIDKQVIDGCEKLGEFSHSQKSRDYWKWAAGFMENIQNLPFEKLNYKQRNRARLILNGLRRENLMSKNNGEGRLDFFGDVVNRCGEVELELINGAKVEGVLTGDDKFNLLLEKGEEIFIYPKHGVISAKIL